MSITTSDALPFAEVAGLIRQARAKAYAAVNLAQIDLYWEVGAYISGKISEAVWGEGTVDGLATYLGERHPEIRGFSRPNLFRMRQFYETYRGAGEIVSTLLRQVSWSHNLAVLGRYRTLEKGDSTWRRPPGSGGSLANWNSNSRAGSSCGL